MTTQTTSGIKISVKVVYQSEYSNPGRNHFMFSYHITIENLSEYTIQLKNRHWDIYDSIGTRKTVDGEGVIGEQPILQPGQKHAYVSGCNLRSEIGYMLGYYTMTRLVDKEDFQVDIPRFYMIADYKLN